MSTARGPRLGDPPPPTVRQRFLALLTGFEVHEGDVGDVDDLDCPDLLRGQPHGPDLACKTCGKPVCCVDPGDTLSVLAGMALDHDCPDAAPAPADAEDGVEAITVARAALATGEVPVPGGDLIIAAMELLAAADADRRIERLALAGGLIALLIDQRETQTEGDRQ